MRSITKLALAVLVAATGCGQPEDRQPASERGTIDAAVAAAEERFAAAFNAAVDWEDGIPDGFSNTLLTAHFQNALLGRPIVLRGTLSDATYSNGQTLLLISPEFLTGKSLYFQLYAPDSLVADLIADPPGRWDHVLVVAAAIESVRRPVATLRGTVLPDDPPGVELEPDQAGFYLAHGRLLAYDRFSTGLWDGMDVDSLLAR